MENDVCSNNRTQPWSFERWKRKSHWTFFTLLSLLVDVLFAVLYVVEMTIGSRSLVLLGMLMFGTIILIVTIVHRLTKSQIRTYLVSDFVFVLDVATVVMIVVCLSINIVMYIPYFWHILVVPWRVQRLFRFHRATHAPVLSPFKQNIVIIIVTVLSFLFFFMCLFQFAELKFGRNISYSFFNVMYFVFVIVSTIGLGDIVPYSILGKLTIILMVIAVLALVPSLISNLMQSLMMERSGGGSYNMRLTRKFVVILGTFDSLSRTFDTLSSFFHTKDPDQPTELVLLSPATLPVGVKTLLNDSIYTHRITFLVGDGTDESDMKRAAIDKASAVFITTSVHANKPDEEDERNTLRARMISNWNENVNLYVYNNVDVTRYHQKGLAKATVCLSKLKSQLLGKNTIYSGVSTLLLNLLHQSIPKHLQVEQEESSVKTWREHYMYSLFTRISSIKVRVTEKMTYFELIKLMRHMDYTVIGIMDDNGEYKSLSQQTLQIYVPPNDIYFVTLTAKTTTDLVINEKLQSNMQVMIHNEQIQELRHVVLCVESRFLEECVKVVTKELSNVRVTIILDKDVKKTLEILDERVRTLRVNLKDHKFWEKLSEERVDHITIYFEKPIHDAKSIMIYHMVKEIFSGKGTFISVDITKKDHIRFFQKSTRGARDVVTSLLSQSLYASGQVTVTNLMDTILYQTYFENCLLSTVEHLLSSNGIKKTRVRATNLTFEQVFHWQLEKGYITLGVYRKTQDGNQVTITSPCATMLVNPLDEYFVLPVAIDN
jgi:voltage-gated potassium channel Kch